jgi:hypothetical protein
MVCPTLYNGSCPSPVSTVNITQNLISIANGEAVADIYDELITGTTLTLPQTPIDEFGVSVYINGLLQPMWGGVALPLTHSEVVTGGTLVLPYIPLDDYGVSIFVNGLLQVEGAAVDGGFYTREGTAITFTAPLTGDAVQVMFAYKEGFYTREVEVITFLSALSGDAVQVRYAYLV